ncbi:uncharacterized protein LOC113281992 isoform X2 [Papaver somniferum]|uniref:uncharacterized protein LOC113281992 isoform X2 n=1 Tax=Papaver somniferum TaxID=3469 RepID=UPI000E6F616D|nr:uncharacterized protein LOC113281992 isoform X2 [Papaver somniferum]
MILVAYLIVLLAKMPEAVTWNLGNDRDDFLLQLQQGKMLIKMLPMDMCVLSTNFFLNHTLHTRMSFSRCFKYVAIVFDRGKGFDRSISMKYYNGKFDHRLISMHGFESDFSFCASILLVFVTNGASDESGKLFAKFSQGNSFPMNTSLFEGMLMCEITNVHELSHQMLEMWEEGIFLFQLKYVFPKALIGCQFVYWGDLGDSSKMHAEFSARSIFFFLLLARVLCFQKARQYLVQVLGWKGAENYSLQLTCDLLEAIVAQFLFLLPTSAGFFRVELFRVIIARQTCDMHPILLQELRTLLSLKHCPLLTSATYGRIMIQEGFKQFILSSLHTSYCSCEFCIFGKGLYVHYSLPAPNIYNSYMMPVGIILGTQILVVGFQLLKMLLWVGYLRWKFILVPPALLVRWIDNSFLSVVCLDEKWNYIRNLFCKAEVHNQIATTLMRSNVLLTSLLNFRSKSFNVVYLVVLQNFDKFVENDKGWIYMVGRSEVQGINSVPMLVDEQPPDQSLVEVYVHYNLQKNCQWIDGLNFEVCKVITEIFIGLAKFLDSSSSFVFDRGKVFSNHMWGFRYSTIKIANWTELGINILVHGVLYTDDIMEIHVVVLATTNDASSGILVSAY